jgi:3-hydroxybutyryl-CoA dehydrogenase
MAIIKTVGVVGAGLMGSGIAQVAAQAGYSVIVREIEQRLLDKALRSIEGQLERAVEKGRMSPQDKAGLLGRITWALRLEDLAACDLVIEAIIEDLALKQALYRDLDRICPPATIFASNTSSLTITAMAAVTSRPDRFVGLHFFNPVPVMKLVEVIPSIRTDQETYRTAYEFAKSLGKEPVTVRDNCGFIVNRLLVPYLLDAVRVLEAGVATVEDIDKAMTLGCAHPMGPFALADFVGLDTTYFIANIMFDEYRESRYAPPPLLRKMVVAGYHGRKSGRGFYDYSGPVPTVTDLGLR